MEENGVATQAGNEFWPSSIRVPTRLKASLSGRSSSRNSPSFRRSGSSSTPRRQPKLSGAEWIRSNRVILWMMLIAVWTYVGFHVQALWTHRDNRKAEFVGYNSKFGSLEMHLEKANSSLSLQSHSGTNSFGEYTVVARKNGSELNRISSSMGSGQELLSRKGKKKSKRSHQLRKVAVHQKGVDEAMEDGMSEMDDMLAPKRNTSYGLIVGPFDKTEDSVLEWSPDKRRGTCDRRGAFARIVWSRSFLLIIHELSMTGAPLSMMELATEIMSCGGTVSVVVLSWKGGLMKELNHRGIRVLKDRAELSFKAALKADMVIAGSAVCSSWIEQYLTMFPTGSSQIIWWIMENRREYFDRSKHMLNRVKMLVFLSDEQSKQWLAWCEEEHIKLILHPMLVPLSVSDELAFAAGLPCSLNTPAFTVENMMEKRARLRSAVRKEMGLGEKDMVVMSLSSINPGKGQRLLLESALLIEDHNVTIKDFQPHVKELPSITNQNATYIRNEFISEYSDKKINITELSEKLYQKGVSGKPAKKKKKRHSRVASVLSLDNNFSDNMTQGDRRHLRNLFSDPDRDGGYSLKILIGSLGSKSNKVLYVKSILKLLSQHPSLSKSVLWARATTRVASLYSAADVYITNSQGLGETFGRVTIEAMAFGLPILGTDAGGTHEIVEHGTTGFLHPLGRPGIEALAQNMQFFLRNPSARKTIQKNGRIQVQKMYLKHNTYDNFGKVLIKCMNKNK